MTVVASLVAVVYLVVGTGRLHLRLSEERRAKFHSSGVLALGWTAVCYGHYLLRSRG